MNFNEKVGERPVKYEISAPFGPYTWFTIDISEHILKKDKEKYSDQFNPVSYMIGWKCQK
jgi:hypothetical protein